MSELEDDQDGDPLDEDLESDEPEPPEWGQAPPEMPEHVPDDWLDQKPFDPSGR